MESEKWKDLKGNLLNMDMQNLNKKIGEYKIYLTDIETNFVNVASRLLDDKDIKSKIDKIEI